MTSTPQVSVIMNVRNGAANLSEAIESVLAQTFSDWELIFWDDRSTDDSARIAAGYEDARIRYFLSPEDAPLGRVRDMAIRQAQGEWLAFLDQDDLWMPDKLEKQMALARMDCQVGIVYGRTLTFSTRGFERDYDHLHEFGPLPEGDIFTRLFTDSCFISMSSAMLRRSAIEQIGGIPNTVEIIPDYYLFVAVARRHTARAVQQVVCRYRLHGGNMSHSTGKRMHREALWLIDQWTHCLDPALVARRRAIHSTLVALEELQNITTFTTGLHRLVFSGSIPFLLSRPFLRIFRAIRRRLYHPCWVLSSNAKRMLAH